MGGGTSKPIQPANFARESNPASQLVQILPKDYIQHKRLFTNQTRKSIHNRATLTQTFLKKQQCNQQRRPRGAKRRKTRTLKQNQLRAKKTTVQPEKATEGSKEKEETHSSETNSEPRKPQYSHKRRSRGAKRSGHSIPIPKTPQYSQNKGDRVDQGRGRHTFGLRKTEMDGVTNDFTDTAKSSPMTLEEKAPAPRTKPFEKQGQIKRQATLDTSNEPHGTQRFWAKR